MLAAMAVEASCHCGAVRIEVARAPDVLTSCNCSICRRLASQWAYYPPSQVVVTGPTVTYRWGDEMIDLHHCGTCGCATHWTGVDARVGDRMGVNTRLMDPAVVAGLRVKRVDGAAGTWAELPD